MKKNIFAFILLLLPFLSNGQITGKMRKVVPVLPQQNFYLVGGLQAGKSGQIRTNYTIDLPPNTIEWYYMFTVSGGQENNNLSLNLVQQLEKLLDPVGHLAIDLLAIEVPAGSQPCTVYLMNETNTAAFMRKADYAGSGFSYFPSGTREKVKEGVVRVTDAIYGSYWLGIKNPGAEGITVRLEVAAITEEMKVNNSEWSDESRQNLYNTFYENIKGKLMGDVEAKDIAACMWQQLVGQKTPGDYYAMSQPGKDSLLAAMYRVCAAKYEEPKGPDYDKASNYGNLGWKEYEKGNIDSSIAYSKMALALDSSLAMVKANLGLFYLIKNDNPAAMSWYLQALEDTRKLKLTYRKKEYLEWVIKSLDDAMKKYPGIKGAAEMKGLFEEEMRKL